jgi:hypothetical protein
MGNLDAQEEPVIRVSEIAPVGLAMEGDVLIVGDLEQFLKVARLTHQPVRMVGDDVANTPFGRCGE